LLPQEVIECKLSYHSTTFAPPWSLGHTYGKAEVPP